MASPADVLKLDGPLVDSSGDADAVMTGVVLSLAHALKMRVAGGGSITPGNWSA